HPDASDSIFLDEQKQTQTARKRKRNTLAQTRRPIHLEHAMAPGGNANSAKCPVRSKDLCLLAVYESPPASFERVEDDQEALGGTVRRELQARRTPREQTHGTRRLRGFRL